MTGTSKRRGWLASLFDRREEDDDREYELVVLEGADADLRFRLDRPAIQIGRAIPGSFRADTILLADRSVSARHALITRENGRFSIEHLPSATNPTLVNGRRVKRKRLREGDRIVLGLVVLELRAVPAPRPAPQRDPLASLSRESAREDAPAALLLREGVDALRNRVFALSKRRTSIGRDRDCEIALDLAAVSRNHAALVWEGDRLFLIHESRHNPTRVNGARVEDRTELFDGDEILIAEQVCFEVVFAKPTPTSREQTAHDDDEDATRYESIAPAARAARSAATPIEPDEGMRTVVRPAPPGLDDEARTVVRAPSPAIDDEDDEDRDEARTVYRPAPPPASQSAAEPEIARPAPVEATVAAVVAPLVVEPAHATVVFAAAEPPAAPPPVLEPEPTNATIVAFAEPALATVAEPPVVEPAHATVVFAAAAPPVTEPVLEPAPADATVVAAAEPVIAQAAQDAQAGPLAATIVAEPIERSVERTAAATMIIEGGEDDPARIRSAADTLILEGPGDEDDEPAPA